MNRFLAVSCCCLLLAGSIACASADAESEAAFEQANKLYEEGRFLEAIQAYQSLRTNSPTLALHFNLGNAYFKSGQIGEALAEYHQAARLAPRDADVRANMKFARARVTGPSYTPGWLQQNAQTLTPREWTMATTGLVWAFCLLLALVQLRPRWRAALRSWTFLAGTLTVMVVACAFWAARLHATTRMAVVTQRDAVMRLGPFEESQSALELKNGAALRVLDRKDDWIQVTVDNRQVGWVPADAVRLVEPRANDS